MERQDREIHYLSRGGGPCHLQWAERQAEPITQEKYEQAVGFGPTTWDRGSHEVDHLRALNCAIRGFLSNCISGEAQTIFKKAGTLMGAEAWRRISRCIDHGRDIRF